MKTDQLKTWATISDQPANYYVHANEEERAIMREWMRSVMTTNQVTVEFHKADGTLRTMHCTLDPGIVPQIIKEDRPNRAPNLDTCVVWDTDKGEWRSFRWDRLHKFAFDLG